MKSDDGEQLFNAMRDALDRSTPAFDHAAVRRRVLEARGAGARPRKLGYRLALTAVALSLALATVIAVLARNPAAPTFQVAGKSRQVGEWLHAQSQPLSLDFSEGSRVLLGEASQGRVSRLSPGTTRIELERGSLKAAVVRRPGANWTFGAGPFEVTVLGTQLEVSWAPEAGRFELRVTSGAVSLSGPLLERAQEVRTGQVCRVDLNARLVELGGAVATVAAQSQPSASQPGSAASSSSAPAPVIGAEKTGIEPAKPNWAALARAGRHGEAIAAVERTGLAVISNSASPESLLELARAARLAGRPDLERAALLACRSRSPGQAPAAQAAYLLGRASSPAEAVSWFEVYLREQPNGLLAREASGRLVESYLATGNRVSARRAATRYLAAYPDGPHASMARRLVNADERE